MFYETPTSSDLKFRHDSGKVGRISVDVGSMAVPDLVKELEWIVPGDYQWDMRPAGENVFRVVFPSKADLTRVCKIRKIPIEDTRFLHFEEWSAADLDLFALTETWVRVFGCPYKLRCDYLALFAIGSLIGKTQEVDMAFTRESSVVRMRVLVTDLKFIPNGTVDHVYDGVGYGIRFKVEGDADIEKGDISMEEAGGGDDKEAPSDSPDDNLSREDQVNGDKNSSNNTPMVAKINGKDGASVGNQAASAPPLRVGRIVCVDSSVSPILAPARVLWADHEDEESLPSPLHPIRASSFDGFPDDIDSPAISACDGPLSPKSPAAAAILPVFSAVSGDLGVAARSPPPAVAENSPVSSAAPACPCAAASSKGVVLVAAAAEIPATAELPAAAASSMDAYLVAAAAELPAEAEIRAAVSIVSPIVSPAILMHDSVGLATHVAEGSPTAGSDFVSFPPGSPNFVHGAGRVAEGTGVFLGGRYSNEELISFGGIPNTQMHLSDRARESELNTMLMTLRWIGQCILPRQRILVLFKVLMRTQSFFYILFRMMILLLEL
jgi:hypothetical protein